MNVAVIPTTGEMFEVTDPRLVSAQTRYDFSDYKRMSMTLSREHEQAIDAAEEAGKKLSEAEKEYHKQLALAVGRLKPQGATVAETLAKGEPLVLNAKGNRDAAAAEERAAMERVRLCRDDRTALLTMGAWSKAQEGWEQ